MNLLILFILPLLMAAVIFVTGKKCPAAARWMLPGTAAVHFALTLWTLYQDSAAELNWHGNIWLKLDPAGCVILFITSLLFLAVAFQTVFWLPAEYEAAAVRHGGDPRSHFLPEHIFLACIPAFAGTMTLVITSWNLGLLWVAVEATTLCSAPLILFHRSSQALEAMWKYLLICSVGIAFALFGTMLLGAAVRTAEGAPGLWYEQLQNTSRAAFDPAWFKAAWIFILAGYGTKMGLVPFHAWLPDAHSEAPGTVSAMLSGSLLNCSLLGIIRFYNLAPEGLLPFCKVLLAGLGLISLLVAALFIIRQGDFKRMLAYSSVEHMGIAALLLVFCGDKVMLPHLLGHSLIKMALFLTAGNILLAYGSRSIAGIGGMLGSLRQNAVVWIGGILLICGAPPSPLFVTEYTLIASAPAWIGITVAVLLFAIFAGMTMAALRMSMGAEGSLQCPAAQAECAEKLSIIPAVMCLAATLLGICFLWAVNLRWSL